MKTTRKTRRLIDAAKTDELILKLSETDPRKPGYVSKKPRNILREARKTKGLDFSKCVAVNFQQAILSDGIPGIVLVQNKARTDKPILRVYARKVPWMIPDAIKPAMGIEVAA